MKKLFAILAIFGLMSVGLPTILSAQDAPAAPAVEETAPAAEEEPSTEEATSEESPKAEQSQEDNTLTVPITPQDEPLSGGELEVEGKKEEIPEKKDDGILVIPNQKEKKDDGTLVIPNQKKEKKEEDTGIYFDDSNSSESIELEDEYFELEGF